METETKKESVPDAVFAKAMCVTTMTVNRWRRFGTAPKPMQMLAGFLFAAGAIPHLPQWAHDNEQAL